MIAAIKPAGSTVYGKEWTQGTVRALLDSRHVAGALDMLHADMADTTHAQAHITAFGDLLEGTARKAPVDLRIELRSARLSPALNAPRPVPTARPPTPYARQLATSPAPPLAPTAAPSPP